MALSDCKGDLAKVLLSNSSNIRHDCHKLTRQEKIEVLKQIYLRFLVEDGLDGTGFDCKVLDALDSCK